MRVYINPENISKLGIRVYVDEKLNKEVVLKNENNIAFFDIVDDINHSLCFELADFDRLKDPICMQTEKISAAKKKELFADKRENTLAGRRVMGLVYPYKTVITNWKSNISEIYCNIISLGDLSVAALIVEKCKNSEMLEPFDCRQILERIPSKKTLTRKKFKFLFINILAFIIILPVVAFMLNFALSTETSNQFDARSNFAIAFLCAAPTFLIPYAVYFKRKGTFEVLDKCKEVPAEQIDVAFESEYYKKHTVQ